MASMNVLFLDIETAPNLVYTWGLWDQNVALNQLLEPTRVLCFAAKWQGQRTVQYWSEASGEMLEAAHGLLDEADVVVTYNGRRFDLPHLNREFLEAGMTPPAPYQQVDLFLVAKKQFRFVSNKMEHLSQRLGHGGKAKHEGFELWSKCLAGNETAWRQMERYNKRDVVVTERLYNAMLPWIPGHPNRNLYDGAGGCPTCGAEGPLQKRGFYRTKVSKFQQWQCQSCGGWFRDTGRIVGVHKQGAVL